MAEVLATTRDSPGESFDLPSGGTQSIECDTHNGGTWTLQKMSEGGTWIDTDVDFTGVGIQFFHVPAGGASYRMNGGTTGARVYCTGVLIDA